MTEQTSASTDTREAWATDYATAEATYAAAEAKAESDPDSGGCVSDNESYAHDDALADLAHRASTLLAVPPSVWVAVVEWGEDYGDRHPAIIVGTTEDAVRFGACEEVVAFICALAEPESHIGEFFTTHGEEFRDGTIGAVQSWLDAMSDFDMPAFLTVEQRPVRGA